MNWEGCTSRCDGIFVKRMLNRFRDWCSRWLIDPKLLLWIIYTDIVIACVRLSIRLLNNTLSELSYLRKSLNCWYLLWTSLATAWIWTATSELANNWILLRLWRMLMPNGVVRQICLYHLPEVCLHACWIFTVTMKPLVRLWPRSWTWPVKNCSAVQIIRCTILDLKIAFMLRIEFLTVVMSCSLPVLLSLPRRLYWLIIVPKINTSHLVLQPILCALILVLSQVWEELFGRTDCMINGSIELLIVIADGRSRWLRLDLLCSLELRWRLPTSSRTPLIPGLLTIRSRSARILLNQQLLLALLRRVWPGHEHWLKISHAFEWRPVTHILPHLVLLLFQCIIGLQVIGEPLHATEELLTRPSIRIFQYPAGWSGIDDFVLLVWGPTVVLSCGVPWCALKPFITSLKRIVWPETRNVITVSWCVNVLNGCEWVLLRHLIEHNFDDSWRREWQRLQDGLTLSINLRASTPHEAALIWIAPLLGCCVHLPITWLVHVVEMNIISSVSLIWTVGTSTFRCLQWAEFANFFSLDALAALPF